MAELFVESDDSSNEILLKTENEYAKKYDTWREKEELYKLEQKYGENGDEADLESSDSEDDDDPPEISEITEKDFLKTLSLLKDKDPRIYNPEYKFFQEEEMKKGHTENKESVEQKPKKNVSSLAAAFEASDDESNTEIFRVEKPAEPVQSKEDKLKEFLTGKVEQLDGETEADLQPLKALWSDPKLNEGEAFLRDYILNKKYLEYDDGGPSEQLLDDAALEADEATVEEQGKFERAYNFRFEEPDREFLKRYPRTIGGTRPKDDRRAKKRTEVRERKEAEKRKKMEEIARLKALKLKEIQQKIEQIKNVTGNKQLAFQDQDIEGDFDPEEHDRRMAAIFNEEYYGEDDAQKPVFPDLDEELEIENWDNYEEEIGAAAAGNTPHCEDDNFNMDADYDPKKSRTTLMEEIKETLGKKRRNRKRKSKLAQLLAKEKPKFEPDTADKTYAEYMEEYYKMDCEDVIGGDLPTRFKYREVVPNSYGLSIEEILLADDKELNKWVPLKKAVKYRPEHVERGEVKTYQLKAKDEDLKRKVLPSLYRDVENPSTAEEPTKKKKKKRKSNCPKNVLDEPSTSSAQPSTSSAEPLTRSVVDIDVGTSLHPLDETKKSGKKKGQIDVSIRNTNEISVESSTEKNIKKKKMKRKNNETNMDNIENSVEDTTFNAIEKGYLAHTAKKTNEIVDKSIESSIKKRKKKNKLQRQRSESENITLSNKNDKMLKRKAQANSEYTEKKIKFNPKDHKDKSGLSDERLKAYGLNPKKYRNFLKHKKF